MNYRHLKFADIFTAILDSKHLSHRIIAGASALSKFIGADEVFRSCTLKGDNNTTCQLIHE